MSRPILILIVCLGVSVAGVTAWMVIAHDGSPPPGGVAPSTPMIADEERQERRDNFFGGDADRDVRGGQEMRPQW